ncbi:transcription factor NIGTH1-like [Zingiber officinale]|uniref:transcription factor NIGTH1-like n=1 Tax=Zingiber officinale TaxID=94328 RepID=UPI001C4C2AEC|nr:transcription factor NIGTH1-like [Zingiber officinale]
MGSTTTQIVLDLNAFARRTVGGFLNDAAEAELGAGDGRMTKMKECVRMLEEERTKTEAFKRELPLCMLLLTEVIEGLKMEMEQWSRERSERPFEEFIPTRSRCKEERGEDEADFKDKMNWMSSVQLWSDTSSEEKNDDDNKNSTEKNGRSNRLVEERQSLFFNSTTRGASFLPFNGTSAPTMKSKGELKQVLVSPDLSLVPTASKNSPCSLSSAAEEHSSGGSGCEGVAGSPMSVPASVGAHLSLQLQPPPRKVRRCWPQELHSRFVNALQQLGGAQVATPKQIRDLMKVDGLTNDEVKSHLQKYRLHTRKAPKVSSIGGRPVAVLGGGMWVPQEDCTSSPQQSVSQSGSPQGPLQLAVSNRAHSFAGESCGEEDEKSDSYTWR